jgi:hypothetical protein
LAIILGNQLIEFLAFGDHATRTAQHPVSQAIVCTKITGTCKKKKRENSQMNAARRKKKFSSYVVQLATLSKFSELAVYYMTTD